MQINQQTQTNVMNRQKNEQTIKHSNKQQTDKHINKQNKNRQIERQTIKTNSRESLGMICEVKPLAQIEWASDSFANMWNSNKETLHYHKQFCRFSCTKSSVKQCLWWITHTRWIIQIHRFGFWQSKQLIVMKDGNIEVLNIIISEKSKDKIPIMYKQISFFVYLLTDYIFVYFLIIRLIIQLLITLFIH